MAGGAEELDSFQKREGPAAAEDAVVAGVPGAQCPDPWLQRRGHSLQSGELLESRLLIVHQGEEHRFGELRVQGAAGLSAKLSGYGQMGCHAAKRRANLKKAA